MIVGKGNISSMLTDRDDVTFFASGVSDSLCTDEKEFEREINLLLSMPKEKHIVYFSSLGIFRWDSRYMKHKKTIEKLIKDTFNSYTIVRVEVISWGKNPNTIHNYFRRMLNEGKAICLQDTIRYVVDSVEFKYWMNYIRVGERDEMNITGKPHHVCDIYKMVKEGHL